MYLTSPLLPNPPNSIKPTQTSQTKYIYILTNPVKPVLEDATREILAQKQEVQALKAVADKHPFYKYNGVWTRELQNLVCLCLCYSIL